MALMEAAVAAAVGAGARRLLLGVFAGNGQAQAFYAKVGFERLATRRFNVGGTEYDDVVFARALGL